MAELQADDANAITAMGTNVAASIAIMTGTIAALILVIYQLFNLNYFGVLIEARYLYCLGGIFLALAYLVFQINGVKSMNPRWYDWVLASMALLSGLYLAISAQRSLSEGWEYAAPDVAVGVTLVFFVLILEATRRTGGWVLFCVVLLFSFYPTFASYVPDPFSGYQSSWRDAIPFHILSSESTFGIPMKAFGSVVIGFILFGSVLQQTGGGAFFNDLALGLVGRLRGGAAKVAIIASGLMGSMSGSVISNILSTGSVSIPAMKRSGFSAKTAAATEACASTGGVVMPPIMGAAAFVMASFIATPYAEVVIAAIIPSILFYFGLFMQIDCYAARRGLRGLKKEEVPSLVNALRKGWVYLFVFALLIYMMVGLRQETQAPFYITALLLVVNQLLPSHRLSLQGVAKVILGVGSNLAELTAILLGVGLVVGSFSATGLAGTLANELIFAAGSSVFALLIMGALTAFIFGMGMTVTACYVFLAVVLAPALEQVGLNKMAVHLFILYWGMVSYITPPVALGSFSAASMAGTSPMATSFESMRLGGVIYIAPFFFVLNPALVGQGSATEIGIALFCALLGVALLSMALQGFVTFVGTLKGVWEFPLRILMAMGGFLVALPGSLHLPISGLGSFFAGLLLVLPAVAYAYFCNRESRQGDLNTGTST